ncbi:allophanate hydrolase subunit 2 domain protein [Mycobacterium xenopi 4042]|uniref:Allophanate hydrolase subunit 2 domain protein n=1 Tax=Mycobacterium xenopi 4042 TaxID=1299334 RepID=X7ZC29_MYCXE|nr:allophanate hydrolase subunit 2 domain protein [Mycobacterium xenopi 4042]
MVDPDALVRTIWMASDRSDRVGMRLEGDPCGTAGRIASWLARASPAARSRCRPTAYRSSWAPTIRSPGLSGGWGHRRGRHRQSCPDPPRPIRAAALVAVALATRS